ncbi:MAG TPA: pseudouridine synthase [Verrucomicrobiae bacterium]|nr:pseudouridine synthase [Verrucomicrobiae bacterium]
MSSLSAHSDLPAIKISSTETREFWELPVVYEDDQLLALDKPAGLSVSGEPEQTGRPDLLDLLHQGIAAGKSWAVARNISFLMNAHRLEAEASGVLLLARNKPVLSTLLDWFGSDRVILSYVTLVSGTPAEDQFAVEAKLAPDSLRPGLMRVDPKFGKRARTSFTVLERFRDWTLVRCVPSPNRPHQVRVHLKRLGLRVAGDQAYGGKPLWLSRLKPGFHLKPNHTERPLLGQTCLHAETLRLDHPVTGQPLTLEAAPPKDLRVALKYLRRYRPTT